jgi:steroid delta-isomerase-like uncharacterized protein
MTVEDNKRLVARFIDDVFVDCRVKAIPELVTHDFISHTWGPNGLGRDGLVAVTSRIPAALSEISFRIEDSIGEGDRVVVRLTASATQHGEFMGLPPTGRRYEVGEIHLFRIADGAIAEHWHQLDQQALMRQLQGRSVNGAPPRTRRPSRT